MRNYEAIMASVWTGDLSQGTRCEVARCGSPELAQRLAARLMQAEEMEAACDAINAAHESLFTQCCSNPVYNTWGTEVDVTLINVAHSKATNALSRSATLRAEFPPQG